ncbi:ketoacyl-ACP synthase III [Paenibacillus qinlingensis]|uniref:ketoacyl-ACP synthase III n=1 Tax=Paenibacillus qinlingensis TaxID=1837343 RepID=UPI001564CB09|nr:ketoacyl-ACP synthase III [Paenibacillus qinlingensis]NQX60246.1 ketoacyl-ACP synthase III [Paenibacillus qinlingensis]
MKSYIKAIDYYLPSGKDYNDPNDRITSKIGIYTKNIAAPDEFASDLAAHAANKLFNRGIIEPKDIDYLLYCTQSPDYILPTTACLLQERLGLPTSCGALDFNLGCSGYVYGLSLAKALIETGQAKNIILLTADTYSKYINPKDRNVQLLFGDAASATLISSTDEDDEFIGSFVFGTNGKGAEHLIIHAGGLKEPFSSSSFEEVQDAYGNFRSRSNLYMNGNEIFNFASKEVPKAIQGVLEKSNMNLDEVNYFVLHQANQYMLETLRRKIGIPSDKFSIQFADCGNTVSSTIPIALIRDYKEGKCKNGDRTVLVGFGVGYSWSACLIKLNLI